MKERPILFSTPMVQAILECRKTMTRRIVKKQSHVSVMVAEHGIIFTDFIKSCPYGKIGDLFWVRETWGLDYFGSAQFWHFKNGLEVKQKDIVYKADDEKRDTQFLLDKGWKPSIFMPRKAARIFLSITDIRIERLLGISDDDCIKEGIEEQHDTLFPSERLFKFYPNKDLRDETFNTSPKTSFYSLWENIHGIGSWHLNPWVWVIKFRRIDL